MTELASRRGFGAGAFAFAIAGADRAWAQTANADAMTIGSATAPVQLVEYASAACSHCAHFHATNWATLKTNYIDTGRVRLTLSEMLTAPAAVAFGMFPTCTLRQRRCAGIFPPPRHSVRTPARHPRDRHDGRRGDEPCRCRRRMGPQRSASHGEPQRHGGARSHHAFDQRRRRRRRQLNADVL